MKEALYLAWRYVAYHRVKAAILIASAQIAPPPARYLLVGELALNGEICGVRGVLPIAIAANLALGHTPADAVKQAKEYITEAIRHGQLFGKGINPVNHFWRFDKHFGVLNNQPE